MAEPTTFKYSFKELAALMIKERGIKEGLWGVYVRFGLGAANMGPDPEAVVPAAIVPVVELGLQRFDQPSPLAIDAAAVWKAPASK